MRAGRCYPVQQPLAAEAAGVVRQAAALAQLQGNAQVTPLHVATAMLSAAGLLRSACLQSQSHPLQCRALELGFAVALGRLPMAAAAAAAFHRHGPQALSNALVAAFKRAQSRQRRAGGEDGAAVGKVELGQLVVSILDDPNVGRVMHDAGFSIAQVRANVEKAISMEQEQSNRASSDSTCPNPIPMYPNGSRRTEPSLETAGAGAVSDRRLALNLGCDSEVQASQMRSGTAGWPTTIVRAGSELAELIRATDETQATCRRQKFTELTAKNLKILCDALELRVPRHKDIVPEIATTVLQCRSGMARRRRGRDKPTSSATWLLFHGGDGGGKRAVAEELARLVYGSYTEFTSITLADEHELTPATASSGSSSSSKLTGTRRRSRHGENGAGYARKMLFEATLRNPRRVILIDGIEHVDRDSEIGIRDAIEEGRMRGCNGDVVVSLEDSIVVLSCEVIDICSPPVKRRRICRNDGEEDQDAVEKTAAESRFSLDLNACTEDREEVEEKSSDDDAGIMNVVDGVFVFL